VTEQLEQWYCIKFCQKLGDSQVETIQKISWVFGDDAMGITQIKEWYNRFKDGRTLVESDTCSIRPSTSRNDELTDQVWTLVMQTVVSPSKNLRRRWGWALVQYISFWPMIWPCGKVAAASWQRTSSFLAND
jgi:hypothetical protein